MLVFGSRFAVSFYFGIFFLYVSETYPLRSRGLGLGFASSIGAVASSSGQFILNELEDRQISPMLLFTVLCICAILTLNFMEETLNIPLKDEIEEVQIMKDEQK